MEYKDSKEFQDMAEKITTQVRPLRLANDWFHFISFWFTLSKLLYYKAPRHRDRRSFVAFKGLEDFSWNQILVYNLALTRLQLLHEPFYRLPQCLLTILVSKEKA